MPRPSDLDIPDRILAGLLAAVWVGAGLAAIVLGIATGRFLSLLPGFLGIAYGFLWARVSIKGRRLAWPPTLQRRSKRG